MAHSPIPTIEILDRSQEVSTVLGEVLDSSGICVVTRPVHPASRRSTARADAVALQILDASDLAAVATDTEADGSDPRPRRIVLTREGALDDALRWKNEVRVDRYLVWPDDSTRLGSSAIELLHAWLLEAGQLEHLELAPVSSVDEFEAVLRLRYDVYANGPFTRWAVERNEHPIDADGYDRRAHVFGLWKHSGDGERLVGTVRVVGRDRGPHGDLIDELTRRHPHWTGMLSRPARRTFPILELGFDPSSVEASIAALERAGPLFEIGKHAVLAEHRAGNTDRLQMEGLTGYLFALAGPDVRAIAATPRVLARAFRPFGFREITGAGDGRAAAMVAAGFRASSAIRSEGLDSVIPEVRTHIEALRMHIDRRGGAPCFCRTFPTCVDHGYRSGQLEAARIFCPASYVRTRPMLENDPASNRKRTPED